MERKRLLRAVAHTLGLYMGARMRGEDAQIQLQRYKRLGKALEDYDRREQATRKLLDHERYMHHQEERKAKQRAYYAANREQCRQSVKRARAKRIERERLKLFEICHTT